MGCQDPKAFVLYLNFRELESAFELPLVAFYRRHGQCISLPSDGQRIRIPGLGWQIAEGTSMAYSIVLRRRFPLACDSGTFEEFHAEVATWATFECLRLGIVPPEIPKEVLEFDLDPSSEVQERVMMLNVNSVLTQLGLSMQELQGYEPYCATGVDESNVDPFVFE